MEPVIGIIGGSGFYRMPGLRRLTAFSPSTPFGPPSSEVVIGQLGEVEVAFLARHGPGHRLPPSAVPCRANVFALKEMGVHTIVGVNAVGSLHVDYAPGHLVLPDDLYDRTRGRPASFFGPGLVAHVGFAEPLCAASRAVLFQSRAAAERPVHEGGTLVVIEGPRFSTRAESHHYRACGFRLVGMTSLPEAALAREAEVCYVALTMVTDYDVWHADAEPVSVEVIVRRLGETVAAAQALVAAALPALANRDDCDCRHALATALTTAPGAVDPAVLARLAPMVGRYLGQAR